MIVHISLLSLFCLSMPTLLPIYPTSLFYLYSLHLFYLFFTTASCFQHFVYYKFLLAIITTLYRIYRLRVCRTSGIKKCVTCNYKLGIFSIYEVECLSIGTHITASRIRARAAYTCPYAAARIQYDSSPLPIMLDH